MKKRIQSLKVEYKKRGTVFRLPYPIEYLSQRE